MQTWGLRIWTADLGFQYLNCRPGVSLEGHQVSIMFAKLSLSLSDIIWPWVENCHIASNQVQLELPGGSHIMPNAREALQNSSEPFIWLFSIPEILSDPVRYGESAHSALPCKSGQKQKDLRNIWEHVGDAETLVKMTKWYFGQRWKLSGASVVFLQSCGLLIQGLFCLWKCS